MKQCCRDIRCAAVCGKNDDLGILRQGIKTRPNTGYQFIVSCVSRDEQREFHSRGGPDVTGGLGGYSRCATALAKNELPQPGRPFLRQ